jgi:hypothetical protein
MKMGQDVKEPWKTKFGKDDDNSWHTLCRAIGIAKPSHTDEE